jgi:hypothetical protein
MFATHIISFALWRKILSASQEIPRVLSHRNVHHCVHDSPALDPILSQKNPVHTHPIYSRSILILSSYLGLGLPTGFFPLRFPIKIVFAFFISPVHTSRTCPTHLILLDLIIFGKQYRLCSSSLCIFPSPCHFNRLRFKHSPQRPVLRYPQSVFFLT